MEYVAYQKTTAYIPSKTLVCDRCGIELGNEVTVCWWKQRTEKWVKSNVFVRTIDGKPVARLYVRGEVVCECGKRHTWNS